MLSPITTHQQINSRCHSLPTPETSGSCAGIQTPQDRWEYCSLPLKNKKGNHNGDPWYPGYVYSVILDGFAWRSKLANLANNKKFEQTTNSKANCSQTLRKGTKKVAPTLAHPRLQTCHWLMDYGSYWRLSTNPIDWGKERSAFIAELPLTWTSPLFLSLVDNKDSVEPQWIGSLPSWRLLVSAVNWSSILVSAHAQAYNNAIRLIPL